MHWSKKTTARQNFGEIRELAENATMRLPRDRSATVVHVERGTVLVTQEGDHEDHVLERGDVVVLPAGGLAVAWAFTEAVISVNHPEALARAGRIVHFRSRERTAQLSRGFDPSGPVALSA